MRRATRLVWCRAGRSGRPGDLLRDPERRGNADVKPGSLAAWQPMPGRTDASGGGRGQDGERRNRCNALLCCAALCHAMLCYATKMESRRCKHSNAGRERKQTIHVPVSLSSRRHRPANHDTCSDNLLRRTCPEPHVTMLIAAASACPAQLLQEDPKHKCVARQCSPRRHF